MSKLEGRHIAEYWNGRAAEQGKRTVGFGGKPIDEQDSNYRERYEFIIPHLDFDCYTLDYGCGIGRYTSLFDRNKYLGVDVCEKLLNIAECENEGYDFVLCENGLLDRESVLPYIRFKNIEQFFTATVLQHNSDIQVRHIFKSWTEYMSPDCRFVLYENCHNAEDKEHIAFRSPEQYIALFKDATELDVNIISIDQHKIHGEWHAITIFSRI